MGGYFIKKQIFSIKHFDETLLAALKDEIHAQMEVLRSYNIPLSHIDSHHHVHAIWGLQELFHTVM